MRRLSMSLTLCAILLAGCTAAPLAAPSPAPAAPSPAPAAPPPVLRVTPQGSGNTATVSVSGADVAVDLRSAGGIGGALLVLAPGTLPSSVALRLHLAGLEELRISVGPTTAVVHISSAPGHAVTQQRIAPDGAEQPIPPDDPRWAPTQITPGTTPDSISLITVALPPDLSFTDATRALEVSWVDFFR